MPWTWLLKPSLFATLLISILRGSHQQLDVPATFTFPRRQPQRTARGNIFWITPQLATLPQLCLTAPLAASRVSSRLMSSAINTNQPAKLRVEKLQLTLESERRWLACGLEISDLYVLLTLGRKLHVTDGTWYSFEAPQIPPGAEEQLCHLVGYCVLIVDGQIREIGRMISITPELP